MNSSLQNNLISEIVQSINFYYPIVLSVLATVSNTIAFAVFSTKTFSANPSGSTLKLKSIVDILNVYLGTLRFTFLAKTGVDVLSLSRFSCYTLITVVYSIDAISSWLNVIISLDRLFLILKPSLYQSISRANLRRGQIFAAVGTSVAILTINLAKLSVFDFVPLKPGNQTDYKCLAVNQPLVDWINFTITLLIPFALMIISSCTMIYYLARKSLSVNKSRNSCFIKTVLTLDLCFLAFNLPRFILQLNRLQGSWYVLALQLSYILKFSLNAMNIVLWFFTNGLFRSKLAAFFYSHSPRSIVESFTSRSRIG